MGWQAASAFRTINAVGPVARPFKLGQQLGDPPQQLRRLLELDGVQLVFHGSRAGAHAEMRERAALCIHDGDAPSAREGQDAVVGQDDRHGCGAGGKDARAEAWVWVRNDYGGAVPLPRRAGPRRAESRRGTLVVFVVMDQSC